MPYPTVEEIKKHIKTYQDGWYTICVPDLEYGILNHQTYMLCKWCPENFGPAPTTNIYQGNGWRFLGVWMREYKVFQFEREADAAWFALKWS
jgi:hypothetical protein